jgi:predicted CXXCH cytochrome family protein
MTVRTLAIGIGMVAVLSAGCQATTRHKVLTFFFDGVPEPQVPAPAQAEQPGSAAAGAAGRPVAYREHGPYAAKLCNACHETAGTNALVAPGEQLCFRCHDLGLQKRYIHGPLASGGCLVCHDPHSSRSRYLLVSESDDFCLHCHDRQSKGGIGAQHGLLENCTICHDAHMSDRKYLLK